MYNKEDEVIGRSSIGMKTGIGDRTKMEYITGEQSRFGCNRRKLN